MQARSARDWVLLLALSAMWGSAFLFIKLGVSSVPPATLVASRIALGALILCAIQLVFQEQLLKLNLQLQH